jgi:hypothetical protein
MTPAPSPLVVFSREGVVMYRVKYTLMHISFHENGRKNMSAAAGMSIFQDEKAIIDFIQLENNQQGNVVAIVEIEKI